MTSRQTRTQHRPTLTEQARRAQLITVTIELVAEKGYSGASLSAIAEAAGITKAAVLYYFPSKNAVVDAAHQHVLTALTTDVAAAVESTDPADGPAAYIRSMIAHLREHPRHTRMLVEAMTHRGSTAEPEARWGPLAQIIDAAVQARGSRPVDSRTLAIVIGGAIDAIVSERMHDPAFDTAVAADQLADLVERAL